MSVFNFFFNRDSRDIPYHDQRKPIFDECISSETIKNIFADCSDFQYRNILCGLTGSEIFVCWIDGLVDSDAVSRSVIMPLTAIFRAGKEPTPEDLMHGVVFSSSANLRENADETVSDILSGCCAVIFDDRHTAVCFENRSQNTRSVQEPTIEKSLKGAKDAFVETLRTNTALVRRRIRNPALKIISSTVGRKSRTKLALIYLDGVANPETLEIVQKRIDALDVDGILSTGSLEEYIVDNPRSPLPQLIHTERPDRFARQLLSGRIGIIVDGLPIGFLLPAAFCDFFNVPQDDSQHFVVASMLSIIRYFALVLALLLPALYVSVAMYHQEMIPTKLLLSVVQSKQSVPFSTAFEVIGMLIAFELLQEASLRLPNPIGDTTSIIGALIVGQSAVDAKVISPIAVIIVALAGICSFAQPSQDLSAALRIARFLLVLAAALAGLFGVFALLCFYVWQVCAMDNFGINYTSPMSEGGSRAMMRAILRRPKFEEKLRDSVLNTPDKRRQK